MASRLPQVDLDDPFLAQVREIALALPGAKEKLSVGRPAFYTTKVFAWYAMSVKIDGVWVHDPRAVAVLLPEPERQAVLAHPKSYVPGYIGPSGWVGIHLDEATDWSEIAELIEESFRHTAPARLVADLGGW